MAQGRVDRMPSVVLGQRVVVVVGYIDLVVVDVAQGWWESRSAWHRDV